MESFVQILTNSVLPSIKYYLAAVVVFSVLEWLLPAEKNQPIRDRWISLQISIITFTVGPIVMFLVAGLIQTPLVHWWGGPLLPIDLSGAKDHGLWGLVAFNCVAPFAPILVIDFCYYWMHRAQHAFPFLWAMHKVHHSEPSLNAFTAGRHHFTENIVWVFFVSIPVALFVDVRTGEGAWLAFPLTFWGYFIHSNLRLNLGPLTRVLGGPQVHRIHHSIEPQHLNRNFAANFPFIDFLFGTYYHPRKGEWPRTGLVTGERIRSGWHAAYVPFAGIGRAILRLKHARLRADEA